MLLRFVFDIDGTITAVGTTVPGGVGGGSFTPASGQRIADIEVPEIGAGLEPAQLVERLNELMKSRRVNAAGLGGTLVPITGTSP
jgi:hypothetical protein